MFTRISYPIESETTEIFLFAVVFNIALSEINVCSKIIGQGRTPEPLTYTSQSCKI